MTTTPNTRRRNDPQKSLKSLPQPLEEVSLNIIRNIEGKDVERVITAANAFVGSFDPAERYELTLIVRKMEPAEQAETP
ncbi:hypothetical protein SAMN05518846_101490 [Brevibacillus centrosporus]|uniref:Uncharacterized protein n=1 Tax=Brevibacillus centrosporus TaxID=54910 RepID=A0A1I3M1B0_9BACL|nr:hypothetical protein SAMN05518846_101490 [Brevibacillus centrosporus]